MLVVFSPIFVADTKIIFRYDFVAPLKPTLEDVQDFYLQARIQMKLFFKKIKNTRRRCEIYVQS